MKRRHKGNLTRSINPMPQCVEESLKSRGLKQAFEARPAYQQNDYIGWINRAKRPETKMKRLEQMLDELRLGGVYMGVVHSPSRHT
ncbi:MAG: YdeI/OmpD-associated family protein [Chloroflexi bacterium]|nr:YdeI/OmpD-associated family protein [Chloroflexota bacterium]